MTQRKHIHKPVAIIGDSDSINSYEHKKTAYQIAFHNLIEMYEQGHTYNDMRTLLNSERFDKLIDRNQEFLSWLINAWERNEAKNGTRFNNLKDVKNG